LASAVAQAAQWRGERRDLTVQVNVPPQSLCDDGLPREIERLLATYQVPGQVLSLEITEEALDIGLDAERTVEALRALGVGVALDDFGVGHSSLQRITRLGLDELKIDRSFVIGMTTDPRLRVVVEAAITLAHKLGLKVVAEGVETDAALDALNDLDCDAAQGFLFAPALPVHELEQWIDERATAGTVVRGVRFRSAADGL
jgi:EAL domain-containing protein (putative c-di-GMP-specific phosphodiesterase class I)